MNTRNRRTLFSALALVATLCWQAPSFADPPSWDRPGMNRGHDQDRRDDRPRGAGSGYDRGQGGPAANYAGNGYRGTPNYYQRSSGNPGFPTRTAYSGERDWRGDHDGRGDRDWRGGRGDNDGRGDRDWRGGRGDNDWRSDYRYPRYPGYSYSAYPRYPAYYSYGGYPRYYGYYGPSVYPAYYGSPAPYGYGGYGVVGGGCGADGALGVAGAVTGAIIGHNTSPPPVRGVSTVIGAIAGGIIGSAVGLAVDHDHCYR